MDHRPLPRLVNDLHGAHLSRPAFVIGGGPSVRRVFDFLREHPSALIVSANDHAPRLGLTPDFIVCKDHQHTELKVLMEPRMRVHGAPIVSRQHWADYRAPVLPMVGNSGMMAVQIAVLMGCSPVIPFGMEGYQGSTYHDAPDAHNVSRGRPPGYWQNRWARLAATLGPCAVRAVDGLPAQVFPRYAAGEPPPPAGVPACFDALKPLEPVLFLVPRAMRDPHEPRVQVPAGSLVALRPDEVDKWRRLTAEPTYGQIRPSSNCAEGN